MYSEDPNIPLYRALRDGRRKFREVAEELGLAENTVRARFRKLEESGVLKVTAMVNPDLLEGHQSALDRHEGKIRRFGQRRRKNRGAQRCGKCPCGNPDATIFWWKCF